MKALYRCWDMDSFEGPHNAVPMERSALKQGKNFVGRKGHTEKLGGGVKCKRGASQCELVLMRSLVGVHNEKTAFTLVVGVHNEEAANMPKNALFYEKNIWGLESHYHLLVLSLI